VLLVDSVAVEIEQLLNAAGDLAAGEAIQGGFAHRASTEVVLT
jgi:hypothetical protein